ncbi:hypothetical protein [Gordonia sp. MMO-8]|uniref:hypothetical protein n=1 Tax=Gordonia sp. MMO-8 TaxID=3127886 RepID=UPI00301618C2
MTSRTPCDGEHVHWCMAPAADEDSDPRHWPGDAGAVVEAHMPDILARICNDAIRRTAAIVADALRIPGLADAAFPEVTADDVRARMAQQ